MRKAAVIGAGNVGAAAALALARMSIAEVVLSDVAPGLAEGKALDIAQSAGIHGFDAPVRGSTDSGIVEGSAVVIVAAGVARKPGMSRLDLLKTNAGIISEVAAAVRRYAPDAVAVCVTNPLDVMTWHLWRSSGLPAERVVGMAGVLDSARFAHFLALEAGCSPADVSCMVLGGHGDDMVPLASSATIRGIPARDMLADDRIERAVQRTRQAGAEIVRLLQTGSAFNSPGAAAAQMACAVLCDSRRVLPACARLDGQYGFSDVFLGVPVQLAAAGVLRIIEVALTAAEKAALERSFQSVREGMHALR